VDVRTKGGLVTLLVGERGFNVVEGSRVCGARIVVGRVTIGAGAAAVVVVLRVVDLVVGT